VGERKRRYSAGPGFVRTAIYDDATPDRFHVKHSMDVEAVLDSIARDREIMRNNGPIKVAARLPMIVVEDLQRRGIYDDQDAFKIWLNSSEADPWRIWKGQL
jgi:hypothetical protein